MPGHPSGQTLGKALYSRLPRGLKAYVKGAVQGTGKRARKGTLKRNLEQKKKFLKEHP